MGKAGLIIAIDKPRQWSSFQVVNKLKWHIRRTFGIKKFKIGHAGTLDPLASGLLLVCVGSATKQIEQLQSGVKEYSGTMVLGATTPCYDMEQAIDAYYPYMHITPEMLETERRRFIGAIEQVPPMFSAVKVDGNRAYVSARDGSAVDIQPKTVTVYDFDITSFRQGREISDNYQPEACVAGPVMKRELYREPQCVVPDFLPQLDFRITCSKGTYIRSIARDFGAALGSGAFLAALRRERIGDYRVDDAISVDAIETTITPDNAAYQSLASL
ncbi:MAG: tRNA pseudouridine(55) synthase TruB [Bacteroidales bacterium]|nr:tRNA pseudouridine(55) synthase TruB [Bacteroidales bacterium]